MRGAYDRARWLLAAGGNVSLAGDEQKALRGGVFLERGETCAPSSELAGFHFDFAQREPGLELGVDEVGFCDFGKDGFETLGGFGSFPGSGANSSGRGRTSG